MRLINEGRSVDFIFTHLSKEREKTQRNEEKRLYFVTKNYLRGLITSFESSRLTENDFDSFSQNIRKFEDNNHFLTISLINKMIEVRDNTVVEVEYSFTTMFGLSTFKDFLENGRICADSTFGTNKYGYLFITFLIVDGRQCGVPFLSIVSNSEKTDRLVIVLEAFKKKVGITGKAKYFMSDLAPNFLNAWTRVFGSETRWLYCDWHFVRAVDKNLLKYLKKKEVYFNIHSLFLKLKTCKCLDYHKIQLKYFLSIIKSSSENLFKYFSNQYVGCVERWSISYRLNSPVNTNMFSESTYSVFKTHFLKRYGFNRLDKFINSVWDFIAQFGRRAKIIKYSPRN